MAVTLLLPLIGCYFDNSSGCRHSAQSVYCYTDFELLKRKNTNDVTKWKDIKTCVTLYMSNIEEIQSHFDPRYKDKPYVLYTTASFLFSKISRYGKPIENNPMHKIGICLNKKGYDTSKLVEYGRLKEYVKRHNEL